MGRISVGQENSTSIDLYYEDHGSGKPVVLIHGFPLSGRSWEKQAAVLLDEGYRVITYDRRGFGDSSKPASGYDYDTFAQDLHRIMTKLDLRDAALVGFSMGTGEVARYLATYGSERVSKAVLISSLPPFLLMTPDNPEGVERTIFDGILRNITADRLVYLSVFMSAFFNVDVYRGMRVSDEVIRFNWNIAAGASPRATADCVRAWLTDFRNDLPHIRVPTLIVHGTDDRILPMPATGPRLHRAIKGSRFVVMKGAPHGLIWTHADKLNPELVDFLSHTPEAAAA
jgi:non-heme chloroperoxidase